MRPYLYIAKIKIQSSLAYRFDVLSTIFIQSIVMLAAAFFWSAVYGVRESAMGVTGKSMLTYVIVSSFIGCLFTNGVEERIIDSVRRGSIATDMIKPVNLFGIFLAEDLGNIASAFFQKALPLLVVASLLIHFPLPASGIHLLLFFISFLLSYAINWLLSAIFGMWAFTLISLGPMKAVKLHLVSLLSGSIVPLWFFPSWLQTVLGLLPFPYIYQLPLSIFIGKYDFITIAAQMGIQLAWVIVLLFVFMFLQRKATSRVLVQGG